MKYLFYVIIVAIIILILAALREILSFRYKLRPLVFLEVTPPSNTSRRDEATIQLFNTLHGLLSNRTRIEKILGLHKRISLEIVATKAEGIRYLVGCNPEELDAVKQALAAYMPELRYKETQDYQQPGTAYTKTISYRQAKHYALPLASLGFLDSHDPQSFITGAMTHLNDNEVAAMQITIQPISPRSAHEISQRLLVNEDVLYRIQKRRKSGLGKVFTAMNSLLFFVLEVLRGAIHGGLSTPSTENRHHYEQMQIAKRAKPARNLSRFEQEVAETINLKLQQPLFLTCVRFSVTTNTKAAARNRMKALQAAIAQFNVPKYQQLKPYRLRYGRPGRLYHSFLQKNRLPGLRFSKPMILSTGEVSAIYHLPHYQTARTENISKSLSRTLPAPVSLKNGTKLDIILGENSHHETVTPIGLTEAERQRHVYIIGGTGNGKTTMLQYGIVQDMQNGKGVVVIDPHGDLAETLLRYVPEERISDVVYFNPDDFGYPIGLNLLELPEGLEGDDLLREKDLVTESTISVMRKMFSEDDSGGHRIEYVLRNTIQTALTLEVPTLFTIFKLLNDTKFRRGAIKGLEDEDLKNFWKNEIGKAGDMQKVKMVAGITAKIGRFLFSASAKRILEQPKSTIDFDEIFDEGKILICNFSKGLLGEDTSNLFGTTILAKLQMTALRRARQSQANRKPVYLYVDEFQNFATMSFVQMLSEARKYKLFLTMAEQSTQQQDQQRLVDIILANVGTVVCFRSGSPADERLILPLFSPYIQAGEIAYLPAYSFYCRINSVASQEPLSGQTVLLNSQGSNKIARKVLTLSRKNFARQAQHKPKLETKQIKNEKVPKSKNTKLQQPIS